MVQVEGAGGHCRVPSRCSRDQARPRSRGRVGGCAGRGLRGVPRQGPPQSRSVALALPAASGASPPRRELLSAAVPEKSVEALGAGSVPCPRLHDRAKSAVRAPLPP